MRELESAAGETKPPIGRIELLDRAARLDLRMVDDFLDLPDAGAGRAGVLQNGLPFARRPCRERLFDDGAQRRLVLVARKPVGKARIAERVLAAERRHQRAILLLVVDGEQDVTVAASKQMRRGPAAHSLIA